MSEPDKQQFGDGGDQWGEAARNVVNAAKELGKEGVKLAASGTAAGAANSSAALVKAGVEGGKAVSEIAAGTAAGGPWGAVLSTAWSLRHTLYKILVCICLFFLILIVLLTSLPTIVTNQVFGLNGADMTNPLTLSQSMTRLSGVVADALEAAHQAALERVNDLITEGGYDQELSLEALDDQAGDSSYDVAYVLCAYSVSMEQLGTSEEDMVSKLETLADKLFPVTYEVKTAEVQVEQDTRSEGEENSSSRPQTQTVSYLAATIHPLNQDAILEAFQLDPEAAYGDFTITCGEAITNMATALKLTLYGSMLGGIGGGTGTRQGGGGSCSHRPVPGGAGGGLSLLELVRLFQPCGVVRLLCLLVLRPGRAFRAPVFRLHLGRHGLVPIPRPVGRSKLRRYRSRGRYLLRLGWFRQRRPCGHCGGCGRKPRLHRGGQFWWRCLQLQKLSPGKLCHPRVWADAVAVVFSGNSLGNSLAVVDLMA